MTARAFRLLLAAACLVLAGCGGGAGGPRATASCSGHPTQAAAQGAADTRDGNRDGIYCNELPCPCAGPGAAAREAAAERRRTGRPTRLPGTTPPDGSASAGTTPPDGSTPPETGPPSGSTPPEMTPATTPARACTTPAEVVDISFSKTKYPNIHAHYLRAVDEGWPQILVVNRGGAAERRARVLADFKARRTQHRDEYPPAVGRGAARKALRHGAEPRGWKASVDYVPASENASHGSVLGAKLRRFCNGTRFRYRFY